MKAINIHVFSLLKDNVQTMSDKDRVYFLMFDDMSIREHLYFNQKIYCCYRTFPFGLGLQLPVPSQRA